MEEKGNKVITVKQLRNSLGYTQEEFARLIGASQNYISTLEHNLKTLDALSVEMLLNISKFTNESIDNLLSNKIQNLNKLIIDDIYSNSNLAVFAKTKLINKNIYFGDITTNHIDKILTIIPKEINMSMTNKQQRAIFDFEKAKRKPVIAVFGARSCGKSSFINSIIGKYLLPATILKKIDYTVHFKDIKDKPSYIKEDFLVFEISNDTDYKIDPYVLLSQKVYMENKNFSMKFGGTINIKCIKEYNSVEQFYDKNNTVNEIYIIIFVSNSPVLKNTDIIDTIGVDRYTEKEIKELYLPIYMCDIAVCLFEEYSYLGDNDRKIFEIIQDNKFENLMIVASKVDKFTSKKDPLGEHNIILDMISHTTNCPESICSKYSVKSDRKNIREKFEKQLEEKIKEIIKEKLIIIKKFKEQDTDFIQKYKGENIGSIDDEIFIRFKENSKKDFKNLYNILFGMEKGNNSNIKTIPQIIKGNGVKRRRDSICNLCNEINKILDLEIILKQNIDKLIDKIAMDLYAETYLHYLFNVSIRNMKSSITPCYLKILNDANNLNREEISQFSSNTIRKIYEDNKSLDENLKAIDKFWENLQTLIKETKNKEA